MKILSVWLSLPYTTSSMIRRTFETDWVFAVIKIFFLNKVFQTIYILILTLYFNISFQYLISNVSPRITQRPVINKDLNRVASWISNWYSRKLPIISATVLRNWSKIFLQRYFFLMLRICRENYRENIFWCKKYPKKIRYKFQTKLKL